MPARAGAAKPPSQPVVGVSWRVWVAGEGRDSGGQVKTSPGALTAPFPRAGLRSPATQLLLFVGRRYRREYRRSSVRNYGRFIPGRQVLGIGRVKGGTSQTRPLWTPCLSPLLWCQPFGVRPVDPLEPEGRSIGWKAPEVHSQTVGGFFGSPTKVVQSRGCESRVRRPFHSEPGHFYYETLRPD
jgi:hypothetical protein